MRMQRKILAVFHAGYDSEVLLDQLFEQRIEVVPVRVASARGRDLVESIKLPAGGRWHFPVLVLVDAEGEVLAVSEANPTAEEIAKFALRRERHSDGLDPAPTFVAPPDSPRIPIAAEEEVAIATEFPVPRTGEVIESLEAAERRRCQVYSD